MSDGSSNLPARAQLPAVVPEDPPKVAGTALVPASEPTLPKVQSTDVVPYEGDYASFSEPAAELPPPAYVDPDLMTLKQARRLITRVRRTTFFLCLEVPAYNPQDHKRYLPTYQVLPCTAAQLHVILDDLERSRLEQMQDRLVRVRTLDMKDFADGYLYFGG